MSSRQSSEEQLSRVCQGADANTAEGKETRDTILNLPPTEGETLTPDVKEKPCPFCAGTRLQNCTDDGRHWVRCMGCEATGPLGSKYDEDDDEDWNTRPFESSRTQAEGKMKEYGLQTHGEKWAPVAGYEGAYEVSDHGRVRSMARLKGNGGPPRSDGQPRTRQAPLLDLSPATDTDGYQFVTLFDGKRGVARGVHRLVCEAFNGPPPFEGALCRHLDDNKRNNMPANLAWGTNADNAADRQANGKTARGEAHGSAKLTDALVTAIREDARRGAVIAREYGVHAATVSRIKRGLLWSPQEVQPTLSQVQQQLARAVEHIRGLTEWPADEATQSHYSRTNWQAGYDCATNDAAKEARAFLLTLKGSAE